MSSFGGVQGATASRGDRPSTQGSAQALGGNQGPTGGLSGIGDFFTQDVLNPGQLLSDWLGGVGSTLDWLKWLLNPITILRAAEATFGFILILTGLYFLGSASTGEGETELTPEQLASTATLGVVGRGALRLGGRQPKRTTVTRRSSSSTDSSRTFTPAASKPKPKGFYSRTHRRHPDHPDNPRNRKPPRPLPAGHDSIPF